MPALRVLLCAVVLGAWGVAFGDEVVLKNGRSMRGTIVSETDAQVVIEFGGAQVPIPRSQIKSIVRSDGPKPDARPSSKPKTNYDKTLLLFAFEGTPSRLVYNAAQDLEHELGLRVKVLGISPPPDTTGQRTLGREAIQRLAAKLKLDTSQSHQALVDQCLAVLQKRGDTANAEKVKLYRDPQLSAEALVEQIQTLLAKELTEANVVGAVGVTSQDLYRPELAFLFGAARGTTHVGVVSTLRFGTPKDRKFRSRIKKQLLSTAGFVLGVERCEDKTCARAYPNSLEEHDAKSEEVCAVCRKGLEAALAE